MSLINQSSKYNFILWISKKIRKKYSNWFQKAHYYTILQHYYNFELSTKCFFQIIIVLTADWFMVLYLKIHKEVAYRSQQKQEWFDCAKVTPKEWRFVSLAFFNIKSFSFYPIQINPMISIIFLRLSRKRKRLINIGLVFYHIF